MSSRCQKKQNLATTTYTVSAPLKIWKDITFLHTKKIFHQRRSSLSVYLIKNLKNSFLGIFGLNKPKNFKNFRKCKKSHKNPRNARIWPKNDPEALWSHLKLKRKT